MAEADLDRSLGAHYTPATTAECLASWAVRTGNERVLEPSIGGGSLVHAARARADALGAAGGLEILGVDISEAAIQELSKHLSGEPINLIAKDFLSIDPTKIELFDVVLSNPPFTRNHAIETERRRELKERFSVAGAAGVWVHFLLHSLRFLRPGGRLAFVVPASCFFADYAKDLLERLCANFQSIDLLHINERPDWIGPAQEAGAFLLADGYGLGRCNAISKGHWVRGVGQVSDFDVAGTAFSELNLASRTLGQIATVRIGDVTGCNRIFLLSENERRSEGIARSQVKPVVSRVRQVRGLFVSKRELEDMAINGEKCLLLSPRDLARRNGGVRKRLARISKKARRDTVWLNKRVPWWRVADGQPIDAVFSYMNDQGPRLARVSPGIGCTNTLHAVTFHDDISDDEQIAAMLTLVSSFGQLASERLGRVYGGGVLKFELKETRNLPVLPLTAETELMRWVEVDEALRRGDRASATSIADQILLPPLLGSSWESAAEDFSQDIAERRSARRQGKGGHG